MIKFIANWVLNALALFIVPRIISGVNITDFGVALFAVAVISLLNVLLKPVLIILTLPINILTLGLFTFVVNAIIFILASNFVIGFRVDNLISGILGSLLFSIITMFLRSIVKP